MDDIVIASSEADAAAAAAAVEQHHAQMAGVLALRVETLMSAASRSDPPAAEAARSSCVCGEVDGPEYPSWTLERFRMRSATRPSSAPSTQCGPVVA